MKIGANLRGFETQPKRVPPQREVRQNIERSPVEKTKQAESDELSPKGVIRNLQEGHFKGVADVRLRINFQAELMEIQRENGSALVGQTAVDATATIGSELESLISETPLDEQQTSAVKEAFNQFETDVANVIANISDPQSAFDDLQSNTDAFLATIKQLISNGPVTSPSESEIESGMKVDDGVPLENTAPIDNDSVIVEGKENESLPAVEIAPASTEDVSETIEQATDDVDRLTEPFDELVRQINELFDNLQSSLLETGLPEPTNSNGNGVAFDKFMAIYRGNQ